MVLTTDRSTGIVFSGDLGRCHFVLSHGRTELARNVCAPRVQTVVSHSETVERAAESQGQLLGQCLQETLFGSLKAEWLDGQRFATIREAKDAVLAWLRWYDRTRMHSTLDYSSPAEYEQRWTNTQQVAA